MNNVANTLPPPPPPPTTPQTSLNTECLQTARTRHDRLNRCNSFIMPPPPPPHLPLPPVYYHSKSIPDVSTLAVIGGGGTDAGQTTGINGYASSQRRIIEQVHPECRDCQLENEAAEAAAAAEQPSSQSMNDLKCTRQPPPTRSLNNDFNQRRRFSPKRFNLPKVLPDLPNSVSLLRTMSSNFEAGRRKKRRSSADSSAPHTPIIEMIPGTEFGKQY